MPDQLKELQRLFAEAVLVTGPYIGEENPSGIPRMPLTRAIKAGLPICWFRDNIHGIDPCGGGRQGVLEAAHWIKRQQVERWVRAQLTEASIEEPLPRDLGDYSSYLRPTEVEELFVPLAAWDPRNAVPACEHHHRRFDGHKVPRPSEQLVVPRHLVPPHVLEFAGDYGMETFIEDKHPLEV